MMEWQPIETAPKDGTRVMLWRGFTDFGLWSEMVIAEWRDDTWMWPAENPSTHGEWEENDLLDGFECNSFTHWMPLPEAPE